MGAGEGCLLSHLRSWLTLLLMQYGDPRKYAVHLFPINVDNNHFVLGVVDQQERVVSCYDSRQREQGKTRVYEVSLGNFVFARPGFSLALMASGPQVLEEWASKRLGVSDKSSWRRKQLRVSLSLSASSGQPTAY